MIEKGYELQFEIENNCLLNCIHCSSAGTRKTPKRLYADEDILRILPIFKGPLHVFFTGGEPLLYDRIIPLIKRISELRPNITIGLYTTGNIRGMQPLSHGMADRLKQAGVSNCYFSIYSNVEKEQDAWTNHEMSFQNTLTAIQRVHSVGISPRAHLVLTAQNIDKIYEIIDFCIQIKMDEVRILKLSPSGSAIDHWKEIGIPFDKQDAVIKQILQRRVEFPIKISFAGYPELTPCRSLPCAQKCQAGTNLLYVDFRGDVYPCACTKKFSETFKICHLSEVELLSDYVHSMKDTQYNENCVNAQISL